MTFDLAWGFRASAGYVTDPAYQVACLAHSYPHTYTNGNGDSINAGWIEPPPATYEEAASNDPRIAGINYKNVASTCDFQVDLDSGSAPGAGAYTVDWALGYAGGTVQESFELRDNTTVLIDATNGGSGYTVAGGHYLDATLADVAATTTWTGATVSKTFATTTVILRMIWVSGNVTIAHFRLTLQGGAVEEEFVGLALAGMA